MTHSHAEPDLRQQAQDRLAAGQTREAEDLIREAIDQQPHDTESWMLLGRLLTRTGRLGDASQAFQRVAALDPGHLQSRTALGSLYRNMSFPEEAIHWHDEALALEPDSLILQLNSLFVLPPVPASSHHLEQFRQRCLEGLTNLAEQEKSGQTWTYASHEMASHPFYLIYHNRDDRAVLEAYGRLQRRYLQANVTPAALDFRARPASGDRRRKRIGFLSAFFYDHSNAFAFEGLIRNLDRDRFEVGIIHLGDLRIDAVSERIQSHADWHVRLSGSYEMMSRSLKELGLDLLYFTDIGMHPVTTLLACTRSAPVQVTGWGVPQTSGLPDIDHYISASLVEPDNAEQHYTEHLMRLPGLPCCYLRDNLISGSRERDFFFLPNDALLLGCLQSLWKLHPDFDAILESVAQQLPEAWFVFIESDITSMTAIFLERLSHAAPNVCDRMILLSRQERSDYIALAGCLDMLLDPPYFSSGITLYDTIHNGTPIVCLEGAFLRSRYVAAAYRLMELPDAPLAHSPEGYVQLAVALGRDPERRNRLRQQIRERSQRLYDRQEHIEAFADFALEAIDRAERAQD